MKTTRNFIKILSMALILILLGLSLVSCGGTPAPDDASGTSGALNWSYVKDSKTLTVTGSGAMSDFENAATVSWASVCAGVKTLVIGEGITTIGNYAFYGMQALESVSLPSTVTSIGKFAFAYSAKLESVMLPTSVASLGESAFEGCGALTSVKLPETVTTVGNRAFAFCYSLSSALITAEDVTVGAWAFKNCRALNHLVFSDGVAENQIAPDAFEDASMNFAGAVKTDNPTGATKVTVRYVKDGAEVEVKTETYDYGTSYSIPTPSHEGYTPDVQTVTGTANGAAREVTVTYTKNAPVEEQTQETEPVEEKEEVGASTIIAIVIMVVVLIGIAVGAFFLMRPEKKQNAKGGTVRKNTNDKNAKNEKNGKKSKK